ncbi:hypothetical protein [Nocardia pseudovaccinii]|uniref:hypothetical protein n=1 Tax=Nocardia pseudovaccinii TaxID=189540 RepID=UPI0007A4F2AE|nr:hypothetical protein [Nocardia pseudovaccinii]
MYSLASDVAELFPRPDPAIFPTLTGRQAPHHFSAWPGDDTHGFKAINLAGRLSVQPVMPWQHGNLRCLLRRNPDGTWTHPDAVLLCPRQNGKSEIVLMRCLYGLCVLGESILYTVQRWDTGKDLHKRLVSMIMSSASLRRRLAAKPTLSQGRGTIMLTNGAVMVTSTRSADMGRGLTKIDLLVYDEAYNLDTAASAAVDWAQMAASDPQTIYTSTAVNAEMHAKGYVLTDMRALGLARTEGMYFAEYMAPPEMPWRALTTWEYANPSFGVIATPAKMQKPLRKATTKAGIVSFGAEALGRGVWPVRIEHRPALIPADVWTANSNPSPTLVGPTALAVDMTPDRSMISIGAAQWTIEGRIHVELGYHGPYTLAAMPYIVAVVNRMDPAVLVIDRASPAASLEADLLNAGIEATLTDSLEMAQATGDFYDKTMGALLDHTGDPVLAEAVEGAVKRDLAGGGWAWDRKGAANVISPVVAVTEAQWGLVNFGTRTAPVQSIVHKPAAVPRGQTRGESANLAVIGF